MVKIYWKNAWKPNPEAALSFKVRNLLDARDVNKNMEGTVIILVIRDNDDKQGEPSECCSCVWWR